MKIGIISINAHTLVLNFASPLHTYAFQQFLEQKGIESTIIDYKPSYYGDFDVRHPLFYYKDHPDEDPVKQARRIQKWETLFQERERRYDRFEEFIQKYYKKTDICYTAETLETQDPGFDCYICATDVIWKSNKNTGFDTGYFLGCKSMDKKKKIAYAASRGPSEYTPEESQQFFNYLKDYSYISVREKSLQSYIEDNSELSATHVLDPVFFHEKEFYYDLAVPPKKKGYVLVYIVMSQSKDILKTAARFARFHNLEVIELSEYKNHENIPKGTHHEVIYDIGVEEWLGYMQNAAYIFTNSFHACCFSIIFGKQFFVGERNGDKIDSLLEMFQLNNRRILGVAALQADALADIDYPVIDKLRRKYVKSSKKFLLRAIRGTKRTLRKEKILKFFCHGSTQK